METRKVLDGAYPGLAQSSPHISTSYRYYKLWQPLNVPVACARFVTAYIFRPIEGVQTFFPNMFSKAFDPDTAIGNLTGKVILVTGG